ncbi:acyltransferase [Vibrio tapetis]|uniref:Acetyltransferase n=1 Tax=Vibrio tapetis subsp. tapetis TaxID=1671868 RepID=A0A2N8ZGF9_9VIBR|nr:acyltransferase [Vibrio tapetis]SON50968.1 Acetyltransferase [Vibrio tapetis subsp. tapetis]
MIKRILKKLTFLTRANRIGPDMLLTHWMLHSRWLGRLLCEKKLKYLGVGASIRPGAYAIETHNISLGKNVVIRPGCMLFSDPHLGGSEIVIEDDVLVGSCVHIYVDNHAFGNIDKPISEQGFTSSKTVKIKKGAWVGANVTVLAGVTIGTNSVVAAGSIVTKSVPDYCVVAGNPAKLISDKNAQ